MILLVDIGNSRTKYLTAEQVSTEKYQVVYNSELNSQWLNLHWQKAEKIILANVSHSAHTDVISDWANSKGVSLIVIESESQRFGVKSAYQQPKQLGIDRWLALLGAANIFKNKNILIVDAGTATTVDLLSADQQHLGGWILPGIDIMFNSLLKNTSKIKAEQSNAPALSFGKNTNENVNNACWAATVGAIELAVTQASIESTEIDFILLTGGNAQYLQPMIQYQTVIEDNLIFHGLQRYDQN